MFELKIKLNSASVVVEVEVVAELGKSSLLNVKVMSVLVKGKSFMP